MDFQLTEEQDMLRQTVRAFAEHEVRPVMRELDRNETFSVDLTRRMADLGLFGVTVPESYGGTGAGYLMYVLAVEELARVDGCQAATVAAANSLGSGPICTSAPTSKRNATCPGYAEEVSGDSASPSRMQALTPEEHEPRPRATVTAGS